MLRVNTCWQCKNQWRSDRVITTDILLCKAKRQYLLTCKVSRYCILSLQGNITLSDQPELLHSHNSDACGQSERWVTVMRVNRTPYIAVYCIYWQVLCITANLVYRYKVHGITYCSPVACHTYLGIYRKDIFYNLNATFSASWKQFTNLWNLNLNNIPWT